MRDDNSLIHWLRIEDSTILSKEDSHEISWKMERTGRLGLCFRKVDGMPSIEFHQEFSYSIHTSIPKLKEPQLRIEDARETRIIGILFPGLAPLSSEQDKFIDNITELAADVSITPGSIEKVLYRILLWAVHRDSKMMSTIKSLFVNWASSQKNVLHRSKK